MLTFNQINRKLRVDLYLELLLQILAVDYLGLNNQYQRYPQLNLRMSICLEHLHLQTQ